MPSESAYKRAGSLYFREKWDDDGTKRKYLSGQIQLEIDGKVITANVTIFANRNKIHGKQPDGFLYYQLVDTNSNDDQPDETQFNENWDIIF